MKHLTLILLIALLSCNRVSKEWIDSSNQGLIQFNQNIDSLFSTVIKKNEPGAALFICFNDTVIISKGYGFRDLMTKTPITSSTNIRVGSVSKQFTALAVLSLIEKGVLNLSDSIYKFYPYESLKGVTIEQMLTHQSGIVDADDELWEKWTLDRVAINSDIVNWYKNNHLKAFSPGQKFEYNNGAYELLASLVEKISGLEFSDYVKKNVLDKAGMKSSKFYRLTDPVQPDEVAYCYEKDSTGSWQIVGNHYLNGLVGAGGLYTNLNDFNSYTKKLRSGGILSSHFDSTMFRPRVTAKDLAERDFYKIRDTGSSYGFGWELNDQMAVHGGETFGAHAFVIYELERPLTIAIFMNSNRLFGSDLIDEVYRLTDKYLINNR